MRRLLLLIWAPLLLNQPAAQAEWVFQLASGSAYNVPTPLTVSQDGQEDIELTARYDTNALSTFAYYYDLRVARWKDDHAWEFESLHHKLYLTNKPAEIQEFAISHGYNLNTVNSAWRKDGFVYRIGAGIVMTHPETRVRGKDYIDEGGINGFHISGITAQAALEKRFSFLEKAFVSAEAKLTTSYAKIPVADGDAEVPNIAIHGLIGIGYAY